MSIKFSFSVDFSDDIPETLSKMVCGTIQNDIEKVLLNHYNLVNGFKYSSILVSDSEVEL